MHDSENELLNVIRMIKDQAEKKGKMGNLPPRLQWSDADIESALQVLQAKGVPKPRVTLSWGEGVLDSALERAKQAAERQSWMQQMQQQQLMMQQQMMQQQQMLPQQQMPQQQMPQQPDIAALVAAAVAQAMAAQQAAPEPTPEPAPESAPES